MDARHLARIKIIQNLFSYSFNLKKNLPFPKDKLTQDLIKEVSKIDTYIAKFAPKFPVDKIAKTDLAILRLAIYELIVRPEQPKKVVINEAVELAKELGGEKSYSFINGVLGKVVAK